MMTKWLFNMILHMQKTQSLLLEPIMFGNEFLIQLFLKKRTEIKETVNLKNFIFEMRTLVMQDQGELKAFLDSLEDGGPFMLPHKSDLKTLRCVLTRRSFIPQGIFAGERLVGYSLVRLLFTKKASYSILVSKNWRGFGIGLTILDRQLRMIKTLGFIPCSAVSKKNEKSLKMLRAYGVEFLDDLGDYYLVGGKQ